MIANLLLAAEIVSALAVLIGVIIGAGKMVKWCKNITEGQRCQLRSDMLLTYYHHKDEKRIRQHERENFDKLYSAYKALGGNSFIDDINAEVREWVIET